jgi:hypothetical protein
MSKKQRAFGQLLKAYLDKEGRRYNWVPTATKIKYFRLMRIFNGSEPTMLEVQELANCLGLKLEDMYHLDHFVGQS